MDSALSEAKPGSQQFRALLQKHDQLAKSYEKVTGSKTLKGIGLIKKATNPTPEDLHHGAKAGINRLKKLASGSNASPAPGSASKPSAGSGEQSTLARLAGKGGKLLKGAVKGVPLVSLGLTSYDNVKKDGPVKGGLETAGGQVAGDATTVGIETACIPADATVIAAAPCIIGGVVLGSVANTAGTKLTSIVIDNRREIASDAKNTLLSTVNPQSPMP